MAFNARMTMPMRQLLLKPSQARAFSSTHRLKDRFAFIGLGQMGYNMAKNLQAKLPSSDTILIHDINTDVLSRFSDEVKGLTSGAKVEIVDTVRQAAEESETVITVLPQPSHVANVFSQILKPAISSSGLSKERIFIDCSTIDPSTSKGVADAVNTVGAGKFVDAPMSGGTFAAKAGTLTFMLGAPDSHLERVETVLKMMGKAILHCGEQGAGLSAKLANNYLLAISNIATAEAMNIGIRSGLNPKVLANIINVSSGRCWPSEINNPVKGVVDGAPAENDYEGGFGIALMKKDLGLAIKAAQEYGAKLELGDRAMEVYDVAEKDDRCKGKDFSVIYRYLDGVE